MGCLIFIIGIFAKKPISHPNGSLSEPPELIFASMCLLMIFSRIARKEPALYIIATSPAQIITIKLTTDGMKRQNIAKSNIVLSFLSMKPMDAVSRAAVAATP